MTTRSLPTLTLALALAGCAGPSQPDPLPPPDPTRAPPPVLAVVVSADSASLSSGQAFTLLVDVSNTGGGAAGGVHVLAPTQVGAGHVRVLDEASPATAELPPGQTQRFTLRLEAEDPGALSLGISATGSASGTGDAVSADAMPLPLTVEGPPLLMVTAVSAPPTVDVGQPFTVDVTVLNAGQASATGVSPQLDTGAHAEVLAAPPVAPATLLAGERQTFHVTVRASVEDTLLFTANAAGLDGNSGQSVKSTDARVSPILSEQPARLEATLHFPSPMTSGQTVTAMLLVRNTGTAIARAVVPVPALPLAVTTGGDASAVTHATAPAGVDIPGGGMATFTWPYVASGAGTFTVTAKAAGTDLNSLAAVETPGLSVTATVQHPSVLRVLAITAPDVINPGQGFDLAVSVKNEGGAPALDVVPDPLAPLLTPGEDAAANTTSAPAPQTLAPGATGTFTFHYTEAATGLGSLAFTCGARGVDGVSGATLAAVPTQSGLTLVRAPPALIVEAVTLPATVSRGQTFEPKVIVRNTGGSTATAVAPVFTFGATSLAGAALSTPPAPVTIASGARHTFTLQAVENGTGTGTLTAVAHATGTNPNFGTAVNSPNKAASPATVQVPASLSIVMFMLPPDITRGGRFALGMSIANDGQALAQVDAPAPPVATKTGGAAATGVSSPALVHILGGGILSLTWWFNESGSGPGTLAFTAGLTGSDTNSGAALTVPPQTSTTGSVAAPLTCNGSLTWPGVDGRPLDGPRADLMPGTDRLRLKAYVALPGELHRVLGNTPSTINNQGSAFNAPKARWSSEQTLSAVSLFTVLVAADQGCSTLVASPPQFATAPSSTTAATQCQAWQRAFWSAEPTPSEINACATFAVSADNAGATPQAKWAATCASVVAAMGFLAE